MATHLISVFSNIQPFFAIFFTYQEKHLDFSFDADHKLFLFLNLLFHAILTSYFSTFTYPLACTGSTISSFLLFIPNKLMK